MVYGISFVALLTNQGQRPPNHTVPPKNQNKLKVTMSWKLRRWMMDMNCCLTVSTFSFTSGHLRGFCEYCACVPSLRHFFFVSCKAHTTAPMSKLLSAITAGNEGILSHITEDSSHAQILRELASIKQLLSKVALSVAQLMFNYFIQSNKQYHKIY